MVLLNIGLLSSGVLESSDFGTVGLIDIPSARMSKDGNLTLTSAIQSRSNSYAVTYQVTPWLEGTFRYTGFNLETYYDRNDEIKVMLLEERNYFPQIAIGVRDILGNGVWASEYFVGSKRIGNFDLTLGMGWGRLAGDGGFSNPLKQL